MEGISTLLEVKNKNLQKKKHLSTFQALQTHFHTCKHKHKPNDNQNHLKKVKNPLKTWTPLLG
jgi:hypothetical protein